MKTKRFLKFLILGAFLITGCSNLDQIIEYQSRDDGTIYQSIYYTASFLNYDESFLYSTKVKEGEIAKYNGPAPTRESTSLYRYKFTGWDKPINATKIYEDTTFIAQYDSQLIVYYDVQFVNYDGTLLYQTKVEEGKEAIYVGETPTREASDGFIYSFSGWNKSTNSVNEDSVFVATYTSKKQSLRVRFLNYDDSVLDICYVEYGGAAVYAGNTPTRPAEGGYTYTFNGWDKDFTVIKSETDIHATYREETRYFTVSFLNYDGSLLYKTSVAFGAAATYRGSTPTHPLEGRFQYDFVGWSSDFSAVYSDMSVTAKFEKNDRSSTSGLSFRYDSNAEGYYVNGYSGSEKAIFIGKKYQDAKIIGIDESAFYGNRTITSVFIEDNVKTIGNNAFRDCTRLTELRLPDNLTTLSSCFMANTRITSIEIPKKVNSIATDAFYDTQNYLKEITIDPDNQYYSFRNNLMMDGAGESVYFYVRLYGQSSTANLVVPDGVKRIQSNAFYSTSNFGSVTFPSSLVSIETSAFQYCYNLQTVTFNDSPCEICTQAFYNCNNLQTVNFGNAVTTIGDSAFAECYSLKSINLPASLTSMSTSSFSNCNSVSSISVHADNPNFVCMDSAVILSKDYATVYYVAINMQRTLNIDANFTYDINNNIYQWRNSQFTGFSVDSNNPVYSSYNGMLFNKDKSTLFFSYRGGSAFNLTSDNIPSTTTTISAYAFASNNALRKIDFRGTNVANFGNSVFEYCNNLTEFILSDSVTFIANNMFQGCQNLKSVTIPSTVTTIYDGGFYNCGLTSISLPSSITYLGGSAFGANFSLLTADLSNCESITSINNSCFSNCQVLKTISLPQSITVISDWAFSECYALTSLTLPSSLTNIYSYAFNNCNALKTVNFPSTLTSIGSYAFQNCSSLEAMVADGLKEISNGAFANCLALNKVWIPSATRLNSECFAYCETIAEFMIGPSVTRINTMTFNNTSITNVYICGDYASYSNNTYLTRYFTASKCKFYSQEAPTDTNYTYWHFNASGNIEIWE